MLTGLDLIHNEITSEMYRIDEAESTSFIKQLNAKPFKVKDLFPLLQAKLTDNTKYRINLLAEDEIEIEEIIDEEYEQECNVYVLSNTSEKGVTITSQYFMPLLHELLSHFALVGKNVHIDCSGDTSYYRTPETFTNGEHRFYHYVRAFGINDLYAGIQEYIDNFKGYTDYWTLTLFDEGFQIELTNNSSNIYEGDTQVAPEDEFYNITIRELLLPLSGLEKAHKIEDNYYYSRLTYVEVLAHTKSLLEALIKTGKEYFLTSFTPRSPYYYQLTAHIEETSIDRVLEFLDMPDRYKQGNKITHTIHKQDQNTIKITATQKGNRIGNSITITDDGILKGELDFDKFYDEEIFAVLTNTIAKHFCPCFISSHEMIEYGGFSIYYSDEKDKKIIEKNFANIVGMEEYGFNFVKV